MRGGIDGRHLGGLMVDPGKLMSTVRRFSKFMDSR